MYKILSVLFLALLSSVSFSDSYQDGPFKVSQLRFGEGGLQVALDPAPTACGGGTHYGMHLNLDPNLSNYYSEMVSSLLAAYTAGINLSRIWVRNEGTCSGSHIASFYLIEYEAK